MINPEPERERRLEEIAQSGRRLSEPASAEFRPLDFALTKLKLLGGCK